MYILILLILSCYNGTYRRVDIKKVDKNFSREVIEKSDKNLLPLRKFLNKLSLSNKKKKTKFSESIAAASAITVYNTTSAEINNTEQPNNKIDLNTCLELVDKNLKEFKNKFEDFLSNLNLEELIFGNNIKHYKFILDDMTLELLKYLLKHKNIHIQIDTFLNYYENVAYDDLCSKNKLDEPNLKHVIRLINRFLRKANNEKIDILGTITNLNNILVLEPNQRASMIKIIFQSYMYYMTIVDNEVELKGTKSTFKELFNSVYNIPSKEVIYTQKINLNDEFQRYKIILENIEELSNKILAEKYNLIFKEVINIITIGKENFNQKFEIFLNSFGMDCSETHKIIMTHILTKVTEYCMKTSKLAFNQNDIKDIKRYSYDKVLEKLPSESESIEICFNFFEAMFRIEETFINSLNILIDKLKIDNNDNRLRLILQILAFNCNSEITAGDLIFKEGLYAISNEISNICTDNKLKYHKILVVYLKEKINNSEIYIKNGELAFLEGEEKNEWINYDDLEYDNSKKLGDLDLSLNGEILELSGIPLTKLEKLD